MAVSKKARNSYSDRISSSKRTRRRKPINADWMVKIQPLTDNQKRVFEAYEQGKNIFIYGSAGTGKSFLALYLSLREALQEYSQVEKIYIVRSLVPTRDIGHLPGTVEEKSEQYMQFYSDQIKKMFSLDSDVGYDMLIGALQEQGTIEFLTTSFLRGSTFDNCVIIVDESSNLSGHELSTITTRLGQNAKILFCGDKLQADLTKQSERNGWDKFIHIISNMPNWFEIVHMTPEDVVRSGLVRDFIITQEKLGITLN